MRDRLSEAVFWLFVVALVVLALSFFTLFFAQLLGG